MIFLSKACLKKGITQIYGMDLFTGTPSWKQNYDTFEEAQSRLKRYNLDCHVRLIRAHSQEYHWNKEIDVLHLDANHEYQAVSMDIRKYAPFVTIGGIIIFDDYDAAHLGVRKAIHELLLTSDEFEIVAVHYEGEEYGSICLRRAK